MKSKAEELQQFKRFLGRLEKGGYLDMMFGNLLGYVELQIRNDFGVDIRDIIRGYEEASYDKVQLERKVEEQVKLKEDAQADYAKVNKDRAEMALEIQRLKQIESDYERVQMQITELREAYQKAVQERDQLDAQVRTDGSRMESAKAEIGRLKGKLFDYFEEIQELKEKLGINKS